MPKGLSLHIGLNFVDPDHYDGWDGELAACEFDAKDMAALAKSRGFTATKLIRSQATAKAVKDAIASAAKTLSAGDTFFLTYSGHGGQVPDTNHDEGLFGDRKDRQDETWCLFDRELVDDELAELFSGFKKGVRIVVLSDSCHSGSVTRGGPERRSNARVRMMPRSLAQRVYLKNQPLYDAIQFSSKAKEQLKINASVLLISGCQDNQLSSDGDRNGLFTETLLSVWSKGRFSEGYAEFHDQIVALMPDDQTPNLFIIGERNAAFEAEQPFTVKAAAKKAAKTKKAPARTRGDSTIDIVLSAFNTVGFQDAKGNRARADTPNIAAWFRRAAKDDKDSGVPGMGRVGMFIGLLGENAGIDIDPDDLIGDEYDTPQDIANLK